MVSSFEDHCWQDVVSEGAFNIYKHYERKTYVGGKPALLAIDLYKMAYQGGSKPVEEVIDVYPSSCGENAWNAIPPTERLFKAARAAGIPIIYSTTENRTEANIAHAYATNRQKVQVPPDVWEIKEEFAVQEGDLVVYKQRASAFAGTPLVSQLNRLGVDSLIVCGESTSGCVRASVVDGYSNGIHVTIAEECCFDRHMLSHKVNLFDLHHKYADVMHTDEIVDHIYSTAGLKEAP
ncbi:MAG: isochorismatase family protein [Alphaproteobacteria bacterium]|nr:isochorismatase family protein [Alphaproteobacteria bacterium]